MRIVSKIANHNRLYHVVDAGGGVAVSDAASLKKNKLKISKL